MGHNISNVMDRKKYPDRVLIAHIVVMECKKYPDTDRVLITLTHIVMTGLHGPHWKCSFLSYYYSGSWNTIELKAWDTSSCLLG